MVRGGGPLEDLMQYFSGGEVKSLNYARYWHGYMVWLRPLLLLFDYSLIRFVLLAAHTSLCAWFVILINRKCGSNAPIVFVAAYVITGSFIAPFSLHYVDVITTTLISGIVLMLFYDTLAKKKWIKYLFLITGILTTFFDLLTFPIVSLGVNLCVYFLLENNLKFKNVLLMCAMWSLGYLGMWLGKWIVATILTQENVIKEGILQAIYRTGDKVFEGSGEATEQVTFFRVLQVNFAHYCKKYFLLTFAIILIVEFIIKIYSGNRCYNKDKALCLLLIILIPPIWYFVSKNHSYIHNFFAFRSLWSTLIGVLLLPECLCKQHSERQISNYQRRSLTKANR